MNPAFYGEVQSRPPSGIWSTLTRCLIAGIILMLCLVEAILLLPTLRQRQVVASRIAELQQEVAKEKALLTRRIREAELLRTDPEYVEIIARDRLDLMKPGETIIRLEVPRKGVPPTATIAAP